MRYWLPFAVVAWLRLLAWLWDHWGDEPTAAYGINALIFLLLGCRIVLAACVQIQRWRLTSAKSQPANRERGT